MTARLFSLDADAHEQAQKALPWLVNGRLGADEAQRVRAHVAQCARCQADLAFERRLQAAHRASPPSGDVERGLAALQARLHATPRQRLLRLARRWRRQWAGTAVWVRVVLSVQGLVIATLAGLLAFRPPAMKPAGAPHDAAADFHLLGRSATREPAQADAARIAIVLAADSREADVRAVLETAGARVVDGPTVAGAWVLAVPFDRRDAALAALRRSPAVRVAQPVVATEPPR